MGTSIELCKDCKGSGWLGVLAGNRLECRTCGGTGRTAIERMTIIGGQPV